MPNVNLGLTVTGTDNALVRMDGTSAVQDSGAVCDDGGGITCGALAALNGSFTNQVSVSTGGAAGARLAIGAGSANDFAPSGFTTSDRYAYVASTVATDMVSWNLSVVDGARNPRAKLFLVDNATAANRAFGISATASSGTPQFVIDLGGIRMLSIQPTTGDTELIGGLDVGGPVQVNTDGTALIAGTVNSATSVVVTRATHSSGVPGQFTFRGGQSATTNGGVVALLGGTPAATANGGAAFVEGGPGGATSGSGGGVTVRGGSASDGNGGAVTIQGRDGTGTDRNGGDANVNGGRGTGAGQGGDIQLQAGDSPSGAAGSITLRPGDSSTAPGTVRLYDADDVEQLRVDNSGVTAFNFLQIGGLKGAQTALIDGTTFALDNDMIVRAAASSGPSTFLTIPLASGANLGKMWIMFTGDASNSIFLSPSGSDSVNGGTGGADLEIITSNAMYIITIVATGQVEVSGPIARATT